ncbi:MAG: amidohydrolase family protein [Candidatus Brocadiae bacterium]|nr:amidohydrolase family protein [Candidatus Brocadiia bacterium]
MYSDCHIHCRPDADGDEVLKAMDAREMGKAVLIAPQMTGSNEEAMESIDIIARICAPDPERLIGFAWIEPTLSGAVEHVECAINEKGLKGIKMIPDHWYPYEERFFPVYEKIEELRKPILFHSGILFGNLDSSRFCRPVFYEVMIHFPRIKFALAHISWPWTDECIAVAGRMRAAAQRGAVPQMQMYIDTTRGTPDFYRADALDKALKYIGAERLVYGSDDRVPGALTASGRGIEADREIVCTQICYSRDDFQKIASKNLDDFLTPFD